MIISQKTILIIDPSTPSGKYAIDHFREHSWNVITPFTVRQNDWTLKKIKTSLLREADSGNPPFPFSACPPLDQVLINCQIHKLRDEINDLIVYNSYILSVVRMANTILQSRKMKSESLIRIIPDTSLSFSSSPRLSNAMMDILHIWSYHVQEHYTAQKVNLKIRHSFLSDECMNG